MLNPIYCIHLVRDGRLWLSEVLEFFHGKKKPMIIFSHPIENNVKLNEKYYNVTVQKYVPFYGCIRQSGDR